MTVTPGGSGPGGGPGGPGGRSAGTLERPAAPASGPSPAPAEFRPREPAYRQALEVLADRARTVPGRLRTTGAVLAALIMLFGVLAAVQIADRASAASDVVNHSQPLSDEAAQLYRSLADADTAAATGFLQAGDETAAVRDRYTADVGTASSLLAQAAELTTSSASGQQLIRALSTQLPVYTGRVEEATANNRQGLPLGGAWLRNASALMQGTMLPEAQKLYQVETARLHDDYAAARSLPWAALVFGLLALIALVRAQVGLFRRTNRVFNPGLVTGTALTAAALGWLLAGQILASSALGDSDRNGAQPLKVLNEARITALQCRGAEDLNLVARGSTTAYETTWERLATELAGKDGYLAQAAELTAARGPASAGVASAQRWFGTWQARHRTAAAADTSGDYDAAVAGTIGSGATTDAAFQQLDTELTHAIAQEEQSFRTSADQGRGAVAGLAVGAAVLAGLGAVAALLGIGRRLAEYR